MSDDIPLIEAPKSRLPLLLGIGVVVLALIGAVIFFATRGDDIPRATGKDATTELDKDRPVKVVLGTVGASDAYWKTLT
ncbi:hypothetical protein ACFQRR_10045, partial [Nocardioides sp. GCM10030258]